ncbi:MAG: hypothetical protein OXH93_10975 [Caldilineaceae bacterium]|nr:hypothetical protein [Caldilineaceae bacterium]
MAKDREYPSYFICVAEVLSNSPTPLSIDTLVSRIAKKRPVGSGARSAVYQAIGKLYQAIPVGSGRFGWLSCLLRGQHFRHPLTRGEIRKGTLLLDELEHAVFFPQFFQAHRPDTRLISVELMGGPTVQVHAEIERGTWALRLGQAFVAWIDQAGGTSEDDLLIQVKDAVSGEYGMRLQPKESRQEDLIRKRNAVLSRAAEQIVGRDRKTRAAMPVWELAGALIGQSVYSDEIPPDDMHFVLHKYSSLRLTEDAGYTTNGQDRGGETALNGRETPPKADKPPKNRNGFLIENWDGTGFDQFFHGSGHPELPSLEWGRGELWASESEEDSCEAYQAYLSELKEYAPDITPLNHTEFHLLEAELEMLVSLEHEFGFLMPEQERRKNELADRLFIDPDYLLGGDWDQDDHGDVPFWNN